MAQMRGPFPLPYSAPQATGTPNVVTLASGGIYYPPSGTYLITTGGQTIIEWFDPNMYGWRNYAGPETLAQVSCDGSNYRLKNMSGVVVGASITNAGSGGTNGIGPIQTGTTVSFAAPAAGGVTATAQGYAVVGGSVPAPTITQAGSGFLVPPVICCDPPPIGGVQATFTSTISAAGALATVVQQNPGAGYTSVPLFYIIPQPMFYQGAIRFPGDTAQSITAPGLINPANVWSGSPFQPNIVSGTTGALLTGAALTGSGTLTAIVMTYFGNTYRGDTVPAVSFAGGGLAGGVAATPIMSFCITGATAAMSASTGNVTGGNVVTSLGLVAGTNNNNTFFPRPARGIVVAGGASFTVEDPGYGLQGAAVVALQIGTTLSTVTNTQYGGRPDTSILQAMVQ